MNADNNQSKENENQENSYNDMQSVRREGQDQGCCTRKKKFFLIFFIPFVILTILSLACFYVFFSNIEDPDSAYFLSSGISMAMLSTLLLAVLIYKPTKYQKTCISGPNEKVKVYVLKKI